MFTHYLLTLYRALTKHRLYAALNILGLAVGIGVFLVLSLYVSFETSFEHWIPDAKSIYVIRTGWTVPGHAMQADSYTMGGLIDELQADYPQIVGTRTWGATATVRQGAQITSEEIQIVDPTFFKTFDLPVVAGDKARFLQRPDEVLISESRAKRYFGAANPIGQTLTLSVHGKVNTYRVSGVLEDAPKNTDLDFDILIPLTQAMVDADGKTWRHWGSEQLATYLRFASPAGAASLDNNLPGFIDRHARADVGPNAHKAMALTTPPLLSLHLLDPKDAVVVATIGAVGLLTLLLAAVNYVNLATARAGLRAREVALRKVMGATSRSLVLQFMAESVATASLAALIGLALCELGVPLINAAGGLSLQIAYFGEGGVVPLLIGVVIVVGFGAGIYPALVLSRFEPAGVLASARTPGGGRAGARVREGLVVFQFAIAIAFTIATGVIVSQGSYLRHADLGFRRDGLILVESFDNREITGAERSALLNLWRATPGVVSVTDSTVAPGVYHSLSASNFKLPGQGGDGPSMTYEVTGPDFLQTYGGRLIAGRMLDRAYGQDESNVGGSDADAGDRPTTANLSNVMINAIAAKTLGFKSPSDALGKTLLEGKDDGGFQPYRIVGVIDNIRFRSPRDTLRPTVYFFTTKDFSAAMAGVRYANADPKLVMDRMQAAWRQAAPTVPFRAKTIENSLQAYYQSDDERGHLFTLGAVLAVAIGCLGLYGLASFNTARRVKEIGIRKTLGASTSDILKLLVGQFMRPVLIANLIAWPLAYVAMQNWLSGFDQKISLNPLYFLAATLLTILIAVGTVAGQAYSVARAEPAKALRDE